MKVIRIVGRSGHGKTTVILELIREFRDRGLHVGTIKHSSSHHEVDTAGKDSFRQRQEGADPSAIITEAMTGVFMARQEGQDPYQNILSLFSDCDVVLVEGHGDYPAPKIEIWRQECGTEPLALLHKNIVAIITDDPLKISTPTWPRNDVKTIADHILNLSDR